MSTTNPVQTKDFDIEAVKAAITTQVNEQIELATKDLSDELDGQKNLIADMEAKLEAKSAVVAQVPQTKAAYAEKYQADLSETLHAAFANAKDGEKNLAGIFTKADPTGLTMDVAGQAMGAVGAVDKELGRRIIERARENVVILGLVGKKNTSSVDYREMVLTGVPSVAKGVENIWGSPTAAHAAWADTNAQRYEMVVMKVAKQYAKPFISNEAIADPAIDLMAHLEVLLAEEQSRYWAQQILAGDGSTGSLRGILSSQRLSDTESVKPTMGTDPRKVDFFPHIKSGVATKIGADMEHTVNTLIDMTVALPTRYHKDAYYLMNRRTLGTLRKIKVGGNATGMTSQDLRALLSFSEKGFMLFEYPVVIEDYFPNEAANTYPIMFGDLSKAVAMVDIDDHFLLDPFTADGGVLLKHESRKGEIMQANDAVVFLKCKA